MGPDVQRNANVSPKLHIYKNDILRGATSAWLGSLLLEPAGETVVPYTKPLRRRQMHGFLTYVETTWNKINGSYCPDSDPFSTFQFCWPKHRYSFCSESVSVNVMSCPGTTWGVQIHLSKQNIRGQRMKGVLHKSRNFGAQVFWTFLQVLAWNDTIQSVHGWCSRKLYSCRLSERQEIRTA